MIDTQCRGSTWRRLGPTIVLLLAIPLTAADPLRHVLQGAPGMMVKTAAVRLLPRHYAAPMLLLSNLAP